MENVVNNEVVNNEVVITDWFDSRRDIAKVDQFGYVDLPKVLVNNTLPANMSNNDLKYSDIDNPQSVMNRPKDVFEVAHLERSIRDYKPATKSLENPA